MEFPDRLLCGCVTITAGSSKRFIRQNEYRAISIGEFLFVVPALLCTLKQATYATCVKIDSVVCACICAYVYICICVHVICVSYFTVCV